MTVEEWWLAYWEKAAPPGAKPEQYPVQHLDLKRTFYSGFYAMFCSVGTLMQLEGKDPDEAERQTKALKDECRTFLLGLKDRIRMN